MSIRAWFIPFSGSSQLLIELFTLALATRVNRSIKFPFNAVVDVVHLLVRNVLIVLPRWGEKAQAAGHCQMTQQSAIRAKSLRIIVVVDAAYRIRYKNAL
jgi:hypothetical protein